MLRPRIPGCRRALALSVSLALALSPGLAPREALAGRFQGKSGRPQVRLSLPSLPLGQSGAGLGIGKGVSMDIKSLPARSFSSQQGSAPEGAGENVPARQPAAPDKPASAPSPEGRDALDVGARKLGEELQPDLEAAVDPAGQEGASEALRRIGDKLAGAAAPAAGTEVSTPSGEDEENKEAAKPRLARPAKPRPHESLPARRSHLEGFAAEQLPNPGDLYAQAKAEAEAAAQALWQGKRKLRFAGASASLPARDGWRLHFKFVAAESAASETGATVYVEVRRSQDPQRGAYLVEAQAFPQDLRIPPGFVYPQGDEEAIFQEGARLAPESALDAAQRVLPGLESLASFGLRYRRLDSQKAPQLWYGFYDELGNAAFVNASSGEARTLRRAKPRGALFGLLPRAKQLPSPAGLYGNAYGKAYELAAARGMKEENLYFAGAALSADRSRWRFSFYLAPKSRTGKLEAAKAEEILITPAVIEDAELEIKPEEEDALLGAAAVEEKPLADVPGDLTALTLWPATMQGHARNSPGEAWALAQKALGRLPEPARIELVLVEEPVSGDTDLWYRFWDGQGPRVLVHADGSVARDLRPMRERAPAQRPFTWRNYLVATGFFGLTLLGATALAKLLGYPFLTGVAATGALMLLLGAVGLWSFRGGERDASEAAKETPAVPGTAQRLARAKQLADDLHHANPVNNHELLKELAGLAEQDPDADLHRLVVNAIISELYQLIPNDDRIRLVRVLGSILRRTPHAAIQREAIQEVLNEAFESGESAYAAVVAEEFSAVALASSDAELRTLTLSLLRRQVQASAQAWVEPIQGAMERLESASKPKE